MFLSLMPVLQVSAAPVEDSNDAKEQPPTTAESAASSIDMEEKKHGPYKDENTHYQDIDVINYDEQKAVKEEMEKGDGEEKKFTLNPFSAVSNYFSDQADDAIGSVKDTIISLFLMIVQLVFQFNIMATDFLLTCLDVAMNASIVNFLIEVAEDKVTAIAGIENNEISEGSGIFGGLAGVAGLIAIAYVVYLYAIKRAPIESLKSLVQPLLAITLSIIFISNFSTILQGVNNVTTDITNGISSATTNGDVDKMGDSIQKTFVHRPWLYLQFGSGNEEKIGKERIEALLLNKQDAEVKRKAIKDEVGKHNNTMLQPGSTLTRLAYVCLFMLVNGLLSVPVWILSFVFIGLQFWFLVIACLAPFVLIWSVLPNQFGVLRRFGIELAYPMALKVMIGFLALVIFTVSDLVFSLPATEGLTGYYISTFLQCVVFFVLFLIRKRIKAIFSATNGFVKEMRHSAEIIKEPIKDGIQNTSTAIGAGVGAVTTGTPQGAMIGANVGRSAGKMATGEGDALSTAAQLVSLQQATAANKTANNALNEAAVSRDTAEGQETKPNIELHDLPDRSESADHNQVENVDPEDLTQEEAQTSTEQGEVSTLPLQDLNERDETTVENYNDLTTASHRTDVQKQQEKDLKASEGQQGSFSPASGKLYDLNEMRRSKTIESPTPKTPNELKVDDNTQHRNQDSYTTPSSMQHETLPLHDLPNDDSNESLTVLSEPEKEEKSATEHSSAEQIVKRNHEDAPLDSQGLHDNEPPAVSSDSEKSDSPSHSENTIHSSNMTFLSQQAPLFDVDREEGLPEEKPIEQPQEHSSAEEIAKRNQQDIPLDSQNLHNND